MWTVNFLVFKLVLKKAEEPEIKLPTSSGSWKKQDNSRKNIYFCFVDYLKTFNGVDHDKLWKILKEMGIPDDLTCLLRNLYADQEATVRTGDGTMDPFQIGKGVQQGCIVSPCFLIYMQSTSWEMPCWTKHKLESRLWGEISIISDMHDTTLMAESEEELRSLLMKVKEESKNVDLKLIIQKTKIMAPSSITSWQID